MIIQKTIDKLKGKPYSFGGDSIHSSGFDCLGMVKEYLRLQYNVFMPSTYNGVHHKVYLSLFRFYKEFCMDHFGDFIAKYLKEINPKEAFYSDIMICDDGESLVAAINLGNGAILTCIEGYGCVVISRVDYIIKRVFRWVQA